MWVAALALIGAFVATYLTLYKSGMLGTLSCGVGSCETVQNSRYASMFGVPVAAWGVGYYVAVFGLAVVGVQGPFADSKRMAWLLVALTGWGFLFSGYLTALEAFVINAWCQWCVVSAVIASFIFVLAVLDLLDVRRVAATAGSPDTSDA